MGIILRFCNSSFTLTLFSCLVARRDFLSGILLVMELALICIHFLSLIMQNHLFYHLHVLYPPELSAGLRHNKRIDHCVGPCQPVLPSRPTRVTVHRNHLFARNSCAFIPFPSILVSKSARSSESKYVDLSLGRSLLFCVQFSRFADTSKHTTRPSRRCHSPRFHVERRVFVFGRTRSFDSVLEYDRWKARSVGGRHAQQSVGLFLEFHK